MNVFISYSSKEYVEACRLKSVIESNGIDCWMAPQSIPAGSDYSAEIPSAIRNCDAFVLLLSFAAQNSIWVPKELDFALSCKKTILPFHLDESDLNDSFNFRLSNVQRIEAYNRMTAAYQHLIRKLRALGKAEDDAVHIDNEKPTTTSPYLSLNQRPGTEDFLYAKEYGKPDEKYRKGPVRVCNEMGFWVLASITNDSPDNNSFAENVRLKMSIHKVDERNTVVKSSIVSSNTEPRQVHSEIRFVSDYPFELRYCHGSAHMYSSAYGLHSSKGIALKDDIMSENGALLGFRKVDGMIPGGPKNAVTASIQIMVERY